MRTEITQELLDRYFSITKEALGVAEQAEHPEPERAEEVLDMARRYVSDAEHFRDREDLVLAYGALNYAHGWLDAGARLGLYSVADDRLFTVDGPSTH